MLVLCPQPIAATLDPIQTCKRLYSHVFASFSDIFHLSSLLIGLAPTGTPTGRATYDAAREVRDQSLNVICIKRHG